MANQSRGASFLDAEARRQLQVIDGGAIDWERYLKPDDKARVIPAESLEERGKAELLLGKDSEPGLELPWPKLKGKVRIRPGKLALWAGWSRHGKTQMLKQVMASAIRDSERPLICSMEEEVIEVWKDMARVSLAKDEYRPADVAAYVDFIRGKLWLYDQQGTVSAERVQAVIRYAAKELGITQVVVDSLMMLAVSRDDYDAQRRFVSELKTTAKDTNCTVHLVVHMRKRDGITGEEKPGGLHDIAGGHEIGSIADYVFIVWRDMKGGQSILKVDKQRGQMNWTGTAGLNFHQVSRQFVEDAHATVYVCREPGSDFDE
jgi:twinkle protein